MRSATVIAYHLVWTAYGTWLPNDPRGSGSHSVENALLAELGELHYVRKKRQPPREIVREFYGRAKEKLEHPIVPFDSRAIEIIANSFGECIREQRYTCYACAILQDHAHLVIRKHRHRAEDIIRRLQTVSRVALYREQKFEEDHPVWTDGGWRGFLNEPDHVRTVIRYVERNPVKSKLPAQHWSFIAPYTGWPFPPAPPRN